MSDFDDEEEGELSEVAQRREAVTDDFLLFNRIPEIERPCSSPDLCAWLLLDNGR